MGALLQWSLMMTVSACWRVMPARDAGVPNPLCRGLRTGGSVRVPPMACRCGERVFMKRESGGFRGNKSALPQKPCVVCGLPMTWRRRWARTWDEVKYCSERCRRQGDKGAAP